MLTSVSYTHLVAALIIASNPNAGSIMALVSNAWGIFGAAFGPAIMLSLFWKRFNFTGAVAGIITGAAVDILWYNADGCGDLGGLIVHEHDVGSFDSRVAAQTTHGDADVRAGQHRCICLLYTSLRSASPLRIWQNSWVFS